MHISDGSSILFLMPMMEGEGGGLGAGIYRLMEV